MIVERSYFIKHVERLLDEGAALRELGENYEISYTVLNGDYEDDVFLTFPKTIIENSILKQTEINGGSK